MPTFCPRAVPAFISALIRSPVAIWAALKCLAALDAYVPLPTPGAPRKTHWIELFDVEEDVQREAMSPMARSDAHLDACLISDERIAREYDRNGCILTQFVALQESWSKALAIVIMMCA